MPSSKFDQQYQTYIATQKHKHKRYKCPSDYYLNKEQLVSKVYDSIKLWELHDSDVSLDLAVSHILNLKERKYRENEME